MVVANSGKEVDRLANVSPKTVVEIPISIDKVSIDFTKNAPLITNSINPQNALPTTRAIGWDVKLVVLRLFLSSAVLPLTAFMYCQPIDPNASPTNIAPEIIDDIEEMSKPIKRAVTSKSNHEFC